MKNTLIALAMSSIASIGPAQSESNIGEPRLHIVCPPTLVSNNSATGCITSINDRIFTLTAKTKMDGKCRESKTIASGTLEPEKILSSQLVVKDSKTGEQLESRYVIISAESTATCKQLVRKLFEENRDAGLK